MSKHTAPRTLTVEDFDAPYRAAWGFTPAAWSRLSNNERVWYRDHVTSATSVNAR